MITHCPAQTRECIRIGDAINYSLDQAERDQNPILGIPSGFLDLDKLTRGWKNGDLIVLGGRPCTGKTALALTMARNAAVSFGVPTAYFSSGASCLDITDRLIVSESSIPMEKLQGVSELDIDDWQRIESSLKKLSISPLYLDCPSTGIPGEYMLSRFKSRADRLAIEMKVKLFFVDDFQAMISNWGRWESENLAHESRKILRILKEFAINYGAAVVILSNIGRSTKQKYSGPFLKDLDCYCPYIEDYADKIILLHRPSFCGPLQDEEETALELLVVQNRNGRTGNVDLQFDRERLRVIGPDDPDWRTH